MKKFLVVLLMLSGVQLVKAQKVRTVEAADQGWSGGIAGRWGMDYTFIVEFSDYDTEPVPDTIWVEHQPFPIGVYNAGETPNGNARRIANINKVRFEIHAGTSHDQQAEQQEMISNTYSKKDKPKTQQPPVAIEGAAMVSYKYHGKEHYHQITKITSHGTPRAYP